MNPSLAKLYQEVILSHHREPHHFGPLPDATHHCKLSNPLCGDEVRISLVISGDVIARCHFEGHGCALCRASASLLTDAVQTQTVASARRLTDCLLQFLSSPAQVDSPDGIGDLVALSGVREYSSRRRCATLPWEALQTAILRPADQ